MDDPDTISVTCSTRKYRISAPKLKSLAHFICARLGVAGQELTLSFVGAAGIRRLNREFRGKDKATDVLSFPQQTWRQPAKVGKPKAARVRPAHLGAPDALGDVVISLPQAERNAKHIGQRLDREVGFLVVHGILHLCGHDHMLPAEERRMLTAQRRLMRALDDAPTGPLWRTSVSRVRHGKGH